MPLTRLDQPIVLDGMSDEAEWEAVPSLPVTMYSPSFRGAVTERTEIRVAYDDAYLYVAGRMYDSDPTGVRSNTLYRDQYSGDDVFAIVLDTYNDNETAVWFSTNPDGVRSDRSVSNDAEFGFGRAMNGDWNTYWDVATAQNDHGWFAEMRIPFSSLGFQNIDGNVVMGLITYRFIARKNERHLFPAIPPNWGMAFAKPSQARRVSLEGVYSRKPVYVSPYVLGGLGRTALLDSTVNAYTFDSDMTNELGGDLKYSPTDNLNLDLSVNTDFAQVEVDDQQVNLTRFSLFFPEKRQFFQERAGLFEFNTGGSSRLFHSRRIGLVDGEPNRIYGGARLVGRAGSTDLGVLNMQTAGRDGLPSENFGVLRLRRQVFNPYSTIGTLLTTRVGTDGSYNVALGVDGVLRPFGDEYLTVKWAQTFDDVTNGSAALDAARIIARWERRNDNGFSYAADFIRSGPDYEPDMGFATRNDFTFARNTIGYKWFQGVQSPLRSITVSNEASAYVRNEDRTGESGLIAPSIQFEMKSGAEIHATYRQVYESVLDPFTVSGGLDVLAGDYWFSEGEIRLSPWGAAPFTTDGEPHCPSSRHGIPHATWNWAAGTSSTWFGSPTAMSHSTRISYV
jgi:hypothetical protein